jgi:hypothetical protein
MTHNEPLLTAAEAAQLLGLTKRRVLRLPIPRIEFGYRTIRYRREDLEDFKRRSVRGAP